MTSTTQWWQLSVLSDLNGFSDVDLNGLIDFYDLTIKNHFSFNFDFAQNWTILFAHSYLKYYRYHSCHWFHSYQDCMPQ